VSVVAREKISSHVGWLLTCSPVQKNWWARVQTLALHRACVRRGSAVIDGNQYPRRPISLARWVFAEVWNGFGGSSPTGVVALADADLTVSASPSRRPDIGVVSDAPCPKGKRDSALRTLCLALASGGGSW